MRSDHNSLGNYNLVAGRLVSTSGCTNMSRWQEIASGLSPESRPAGISVIRVAHPVSGSSGPPRWAKVGLGRPFYGSPSWLGTRRRIACTGRKLRRFAKSVRVCSAKLGRVGYWIAHTIPRKLELPSCCHMQWNVALSSKEKRLIRSQPDLADSCQIHMLSGAPKVILILHREPAFRGSSQRL